MLKTTKVKKDPIRWLRFDKDIDSKVCNRKIVRVIGRYVWFRSNFIAERKKDEETKNKFKMLVDGYL